MSVAVFCEHLQNVSLERLVSLVSQEVISDIYAYLGPDNDAAQANRQRWQRYREPLVQAGAKLWGWYVCSEDQERDAAQIAWLDGRYPTDAWLLNIEKPLEGADLRPLVSAVAALGKPMRASLAGINPNHNLYDHRTLDRFNVSVDWQCYLDSGEGPRPRVAVQQLYMPERFREGGEYRAVTWPVGERRRASYGWGKILPDEQRGGWKYHSYNRKAVMDTYIHVPIGDKGWPPLFDDPPAYIKSDRYAGELLGLARYSRIRVTLDVTRGAATRRSLEEWTQLAASARLSWAARRPVSVYLVEVCPDEVLRAIAAGAG